MECLAQNVSIPCLLIEVLLAGLGIYSILSYAEFPITIHYRKRLLRKVAIGAGRLFPNNGKSIDYRKYI